MANFLICGGAGYIGSAFCRFALSNTSHTITVIDNLSKGHLEALPKNITFVKADISDREALKSIFKTQKIDCVLHFGALIEVGEGQKFPAEYYKNNLCIMTDLVLAMNEAGVKSLVFSSTAAVYGTLKNETDNLDEDYPKNPGSVYGETKWYTERLLTESARAYGMNIISFRYFNAAGAEEDGSHGEDHDPESHLIPNCILSALGTNLRSLTIFGNDYPTIDGTCVRDYVHIKDLAQAHLLGAEKLIQSKSKGSYEYFNLGSEDGNSVLEVIKNVEEITGKKVPYTMGERRAGDVSRLVAVSKKAKESLGWNVKYSLHDIIEHAVKWHEKNPGGYL